MCEICVSHTSKTAIEAKYAPEAIKCVECDIMYHREILINGMKEFREGKCFRCNHQIFPEEVLCSSTKLRAIFLLG